MYHVIGVSVGLSVCLCGMAIICSIEVLNWFMGEYISTYLVNLTLCQSRDFVLLWNYKICDSPSIRFSFGMTDNNGALEVIVMLWIMISGISSIPHIYI